MIHFGHGGAWACHQVEFRVWDLGVLPLIKALAGFIGTNATHATFLMPTI